MRACVECQVEWDDSPECWQCGAGGVEEKLWPLWTSRVPIVAVVLGGDQKSYEQSEGAPLFLGARHEGPA